MKINSIKKSMGFSQYEFYIALAVIGLLMFFCIQRYQEMEEEMQRVRFDVFAQQFSGAIYTLRAHWIMERQTTKDYTKVDFNGVSLKVNEKGWPMSAGDNPLLTIKDMLSACHQLWTILLHNPPGISFLGSESYGDKNYHLSLVENNVCRYELVTEKPGQFYFEYSLFTGKLFSQTSAIKSSM